MREKSPSATDNGAKISAALSEKDGTLLVSVCLQPRASKTEFAGTKEDALKLRVAAPPVENAANEACLDFFAKTLALPKRRVSLRSGARSRRKIIALEGVSKEEFLRRLASLSQNADALREGR